MSEPHDDRSARGGGGNPADTARLLDELEESRKEVLRLRDLVIGREAELGTARGRIEDLTAQLQRFQRYANLESRIDAMLRSGARQAARGTRASLRTLRRRKA
jgi:sugar/nucleoside kinase (ribokinase family)